MSNYDSIVHFCQRESEINAERSRGVDLTEAIAKARTEWLKNWLLEHLPKIAELEDTPEDHKFAQQWDAMAKEMMADRGLVTPSQQKNRLTDIRNALKTLDPNHPALADVGFTNQEWEAINRPSEQRISDRNTKFLSDPDAIVEKAITLLDSDDWSDLAAGLAVLTGRRCAEILQTASFEYKSHYSVIFSGSLKRRSEPVNLQFEIPTLAPASVVIDALAKLREWVDTKGLDNRAINNKYAHAVINASDRHFKELVPTRDGEDNLYTHLFRAVYATIATHWYCPPSVPELEFRAYIQGHFKIQDENDPKLRRSLAASRNYFDYKIADGQGNVDGRLGIKLPLPDVKVVEAFESYYQPPTTDNNNHHEVVPDNSQPIPEPSPIPKPPTDEELVTGLITMLDSSDYEVLLTGLMGVTGRTPGELLKSGVFRLSPDGMVLFSPTGLTKSSPLPTLVEGPSVIDAIARLRHHPDVQSELYLSPNQINDHCHAKVEPVITQSLGLKDTEELYSNYTHLCSLQEISVKPESSMVTEQDWADVARHLAQSLNLDSPTQLLNWFDNLQTNYTPHTYTHTQDESANLKQMFGEQQQSLNHLTDAISNLVRTLGEDTAVTAMAPQSTATTKAANNQINNAGEQKVNRAIDAIIDYNNNLANQQKDKWRITISALKQLTKCNQGLISRVLEKRQTEIEQHHQTHQLGQYHNSKGKLAPSITDFLHFD